jgi:hypothetical protein
MFSRWIVTNITSGSVTTFLAFLAGIISWSVYKYSHQLIGMVSYFEGRKQTGRVPNEVLQKVTVCAKEDVGSSLGCTPRTFVS